MVCITFSSASYDEDQTFRLSEITPAMLRAILAMREAQINVDGIATQDIELTIDVIELFVDSAEETWDKIIAVNLRGTITVTRALLDGMI